MVAVAQLVRASDCGSEGRGFESHLPPIAKSSRKSLFGLRLFFVSMISRQLRNGILKRHRSRCRETRHCDLTQV